MKRTRPSRRGLLAAVLPMLLVAQLAHAEDMIFLSTQLRPLDEAERVRNVILKTSPVPANFVPEEPPQLSVRVQAEMKGGTHTISLIGALHGELQPLAPMEALRRSTTWRQR